jgi:hypothetical protein
MTPKTVALAVFLRRTQWLLDDLAFAAGAGELDPDDIDTTTAALEEIIRLLNQNRPSTSCRPGKSRPVSAEEVSPSRLNDRLVNQGLHFRIEELQDISGSHEGDPQLQLDRVKEAKWR